LSGSGFHLAAPGTRSTNGIPTVDIDFVRRVTGAGQVGYKFSNVNIVNYGFSCDSSRILYSRATTRIYDLHQCRDDQPHYDNRPEHQRQVEPPRVDPS
jgi:hypothetical protein